MQRLILTILALMFSFVCYASELPNTSGETPISSGSGEPEEVPAPPAKKNTCTAEMSPSACVQATQTICASADAADYANCNTEYYIQPICQPSDDLKSCDKRFKALCALSGGNNFLECAYPQPKYHGAICDGSQSAASCLNDKQRVCGSSIGSQFAECDLDFYAASICQPGEDLNTCDMRYQSVCRNTDGRKFTECPSGIPKYQGPICAVGQESSSSCFDLKHRVCSNGLNGQFSECSTDFYAAPICQSTDGLRGCDARWASVCKGTAASKYADCSKPDSDYRGPICGATTTSRDCFNEQQLVCAGRFAERFSECSESFYSAPICLSQNGTTGNYDGWRGCNTRWQNVCRNVNSSKFADCSSNPPTANYKGPICSTSLASNLCVNDRQTVCSGDEAGNFAECNEAFYSQSVCQTLDDTMKTCTERWEGLCSRKLGSKFADCNIAKLDYSVPVCTKDMSVEDCNTRTMEICARPDAYRFARCKELSDEDPNQKGGGALSGIDPKENEPDAGFSSPVLDGIKLASKVGQVLMFSPAGFAAQQALSFVTQFFSCPLSDEEKSLAMKRGVNNGALCADLGTYCSKRVRIGFIKACRTEKRTYCCWNSTLAKIINTEGNKQLGIGGFGTAKDPRCNGFTMDQFEKLDIAKMDLTPFINEITQKMGTTGKGKEANYWGERNDMRQTDSNTSLKSNDTDLAEQILNSNDPYSLLKQGTAKIDASAKDGASETSQNVGNEMISDKRDFDQAEYDIAKETLRKGANGGK